MHTTTCRALALLLTASPVPSLGAQGTPPSAATAVPVRPLPTPTATSAEPFGALAAVRQLPGGTLLVNDQGRRRVLLLDSTLRTMRIVVDSASGGESAYGGRPGGLIAYRGDSTLFLDPVALSMLVIDPAGKIVRVMAAPRPSDAPFLVGGPFGNPGFDARGRLVYRGVFRPAFTPPQPGQSFVPPPQPDTAALVRFDLATRKLDTLGFFRVPKLNVQMSQDANGGMRMTTVVNPLPLVDDWAVMSDGTVAIVRGREYRVEFFNADGTRTLADKIPHDWQRLSEADKVAFVDSSRALFERQRAPGGGNVVGSGGPPQVVTTFQIGPGGAAPGGSSAPPTGPITVRPTFVDPSELPDYKPVFGNGAVRADADGHVWVRTIATKPLPGGAVYDVIDRSGKLVDRIQVPTGTTIAGFGVGGVVYLGVRDASGIHLQRTRVR